MKYCMIEIAMDNIEELNKIVDLLLDNRLVSGCQVVESHSMWRWNGDKERSVEYLLFVKTKKKLVNDIFDVVRKIHSYQVFEFAIFDLDSCNQDYLNWIEQETKNV